MTQYLLAVEADKIQDFLFRSSRLREVVGGSQLLTRFCQDVPTALIQKPGFSVEQMVTHDGGGFRILYKTYDEAKAFGHALAEAYRMAVDGSLTVAEPVPYDDDFQATSEAADEQLRLAKQRRISGEMPRHFPYTAVCASCGVTLAYAHKPPREDEQPSEAENRSNYVCYPCRVRRIERRQEGGDFLRLFERAVQRASGATRRLPWLDEPEEMARFDPRGYVAYLVADGNNMGKLFGACSSPTQMTGLSERLAQVIRDSLAVPVVQIMRQSQEEGTKGKMPALPLILGGDDVFMLLPAPWALDCARLFCHSYEQQMHAVLQELQLHPEHPPTMTAAVVVCKSSYPYRLAHQHGERLLKEAKRISKAVALDGRDGTTHSMVHFTVVVGNRLAGSAEETASYRPSLAPYWAQDTALPEPTLVWAASVASLLQGRYALRNLPARRQAQLRELLDRTRQLQAADLSSWNSELETLLARVGRESSNQKELENTLAVLGQGKTPEDGYWRRLRRIGQSCRAHGLLDLLEMWDFAYALVKDRRDYELEGE